MDKAASRIRLPIPIRFFNPLFYLSCFIFLCNNLSINVLEKWNITFQCFILSFMFHFSKHCGSGCTLPQCFAIAPSVFCDRSHCLFVFLPQCFWNETLKLKMKHWSVMFQLLKALIISELSMKSETWNIKIARVKYT